MSKAKLTLHQAIKAILFDTMNSEASTEFIASEIARQDLYRCEDGTFPPADQIRLRARKPEYGHLFEMPDSKTVRLLPKSDESKKH